MDESVWGGEEEEEEEEEPFLKSQQQCRVYQTSLSRAAADQRAGRSIRDSSSCSYRKRHQEARATQPQPRGAVDGQRRHSWHLRSVPMRETLPLLI
ncbi:unnamed protein product [Pleuronectes platessa]|uniref:Uncharacterized protein n=1 Tax=Pleuronectes platessa TaxID=8262 RepID=A0A9N7VZJ5_PLEPL|nr:unnamed protein product [Pleuronectes platessa]